MSAPLRHCPECGVELSYLRRKATIYCSPACGNRGRAPTGREKRTARRQERREESWQRHPANH